tara:strand:+ start:201 stop:470 length:270 start_codon:yes stop_codon:yes gene_type:complete
MLTLSIILTAVILISIFLIRIQIEKNNKLDDILKDYESFIDKQSKAIQACDVRLKEIDNRGIFKSDDEIGWFWVEIMKIQEALNEFTVK